jgi:uncharacterized protein
MTIREIETPRGPASAHLHLFEAPRAALVLGHGAGGGVEAPDLVAAREAASSEGISVALVEQPYRVAGRRSPPALRNSTQLGPQSWTPSAPASCASFL